MCIKPSTLHPHTKPSTLHPHQKKAHVLNKGTVVISSTAALFALRALFLSIYVEQVHTSINDYDDTSHFIVGAEGGPLVYALYGKCTCNTCTSPDMYNNLASQTQHRDTH